MWLGFGRRHGKRGRELRGVLCSLRPLTRESRARIGPGDRLAPQQVNQPPGEDVEHGLALVLELVLDWRTRA